MDNERTYEELIGQYGGRLLAKARTILDNEEDARDAVQEAFLSAFRSRNSFEGRSSAYTWMYRITVNAALKKLKQRTRKSHRSLDELMPHFDDRGCRVEPLWSAVPPSAESLARRREVRAMVRSAIGGLPETHRVILVLRDIEEHSTREVAEILGISTGAVKVRLHRARLALKQQLAPIVADTDAGVARDKPIAVTP